MHRPSVGVVAVEQKLQPPAHICGRGERRITKKLDHIFVVVSFVAVTRHGIVQRLIGQMEDRSPGAVACEPATREDLAELDDVLVDTLRELDGAL